MRPVLPKDILTFDRSGMLQKILEFPDQLLRGWEIENDFQIRIDFPRFRNVVLGGMGGSAIGGDVVKSLLGSRFPVPFVVNRGYQLPGFVDRDTLFIASSYSGTTEETLTATQEAVRRGCSIVCVSSGGKLFEMAKSGGYGLFELPSGYPPRAALGYSLGVLLAFFHRLGIGEISRDQIVKASSFLKKIGETWRRPDHPDNDSLLLAQRMYGKVPLIYSSGEACEAVGFRWKTQLNENSKTHAFYQPFPEMNHNEIVGWESLPATQDFSSRCIMVLLRMVDDNPRIRLRMDITKTLVEKSGGKVLEVIAQGSSFLERLLYLLYLADFVSFYLAVLYGVDPTEIQQIDHLKKRLSEQS